MELAPILVFTYNRPVHTKRLIDSLLTNALASQSDLIVYSDNARNDAAKDGVNQTREYLKTIEGFKSIELIFRDENMGLANNIIDGVTTQVNKYGKVMVFEDDLEVSPYVLCFLNDALETYKDVEKVGHIQAYDFTSDPVLPELFLIKHTGSLGWATWDRAWKYFNPNGQELLDKLESRHLTKEFDFNGSYPFTRMLRRQVAGITNSWAIRWNASLFLEDMLSLNVGKAMLRHTGYDGSGSNCGSDDVFKVKIYDKPIEAKLISPIVENKEARKAYERCYRRTHGFWPRVKRRLQRTLKGDFGR